MDRNTQVTLSIYNTLLQISRMQNIYQLNGIPIHTYTCLPSVHDDQELLRYRHTFKW